VQDRSSHQVHKRARPRESETPRSLDPPHERKEIKQARCTVGTIIECPPRRIF
jgi:hypothetical protein